GTHPVLSLLCDCGVSRVAGIVTPIPPTLGAALRGPGTALSGLGGGPPGAVREGGGTGAASHARRASVAGAPHCRRAPQGACRGRGGDPRRVPRGRCPAGMPRLR